MSRALLEPDTPAVRVLYLGPDDGYVILDASIPDDPSALKPGGFTPICLGCLIERRPEVGRGMDVARRAGGARLVEGAWLEERGE